MPRFVLRDDDPERDDRIVRRSSRPGPLAIGKRTRVVGTYRAHWEMSRFEIAVRGHRRPVVCQLVPGEDAQSGLFEAAGIELPELGTWRRHPGLVFDVIADVTPLEYGRFGHRGMCRWRLRVDGWVQVAARR